MNIVYFFGAGASVCTNMPTTEQMLEFLKDEPGFAALQKYMKFKDMEEIYTYLEDLPNKMLPLFMAQQDNMINKSPTDLSKYYKDYFDNITKQSVKYRNKIEKYLVEKLDPKKSDVKYYTDLLIELRKINRKLHSLKIITTNYDLLLDKSFDGVWYDGFTLKNKNDIIQVWDDKWYEAKPKNILVKLHGSINWYDNRDHKKYDKKHIYKYVDNRAIKKPLMIPLTKKDKNYDTTPYKELFNQFEQIISEADLLVVIGYTFRDNKIYDTIYKYLNEKLHILFISPSAKNTINDILSRKPYRKTIINNARESYSINNINSMFDEPDTKTDRDVFKEANEIIINKKDGRVYCNIHRESKVYYCNIKFEHETINDIIKLINAMFGPIDSDDLIPPIDPDYKD